VTFFAGKKGVQSVGILKMKKKKKWLRKSQTAGECIIESQIGKIAG